MVNEVLFEHEAPLLDDVEQGALQAPAVHPHPPEENMHRLQTPHLLVDLLIPADVQQTPAQYTLMCIVTVLSPEPKPGLHKGNTKTKTHTQSPPDQYPLVHLLSEVLQAWWVL